MNNSINTLQNDYEILDNNEYKNVPNESRLFKWLNLELFLGLRLRDLIL